MVETDPTLSTNAAMPGPWRFPLVATLRTARYSNAQRACLLDDGWSDGEEKTSWLSGLGGYALDVHIFKGDRSAFESLRIPYCTLSGVLSVRLTVITWQEQ